MRHRGHHAVWFALGSLWRRRLGPAFMAGVDNTAHSGRLELLQAEEKSQIIRWLAFR